MKSVIRKYIAILAIFVTLLAATGCRTLKDRINDIHVTHYEIGSLTPHGFKGASAVIRLGVDNPAVRFTLADISGTIYKKGKALVNYSADPVTVRKGEEDYDVTCNAEIAEGVTLFDVLGAVAGMSLDGFTADLHGKATIAGISKSFDFKDIEIKKLIE